ncbi:MAG: G5 domain-containing protein [Chloroflexi bacterium]|nr:G5 domain-containing protein [Chloroflexota bacterium]
MNQKRSLLEFREKLYQRAHSPAMQPILRNRIHLVVLHAAAIFLAACAGPLNGRIPVEVAILADGITVQVDLPPGSTVFDALEKSGIELGANDRVEPPSFTIISESTIISVFRITETLEIETSPIPFERQILRSEAIPEGETRLLQAGKMGLEEITYRIIKEQGKETIKIALNHVALEQPVPEILMIGERSAFIPVTFSGVIAYASAGNAWLIEGETGNRRPIILTGDLDGRIFQLSPDGRWLLFTRLLEGEINSLWIAKTRSILPEPISLEAINIIHYSQWGPGVAFDEFASDDIADNIAYSIAYSTVEQRPSAPGWQANNDLHLLALDETGILLDQRTILESNPGGLYGWWGTSFSWSPNKDRMAFARADGIWMLDLIQGSIDSLIRITPFQTFGDWAWVPQIAWSPDGEILFYINHGPPISLESTEASQVFDLNALPIEGGYKVQLVNQTGMFSYLETSPLKDRVAGEDAYQLAYLQAIFPSASETSRYRLIIMDRDGSNRKIIFPPEGEPGLEPGAIRWSPNGERLAVLYNLDLWLIDPESGKSQRLTADGQTQSFDWKEVDVKK